MAITDSANTITTSRVASEYNSSASNLLRVSLSADGIFGNDNGKLELTPITGDVSTRYIVLLTVRSIPPLRQRPRASGVTQAHTFMIPASPGGAR